MQGAWWPHHNPKRIDRDENLLFESADEIMEIIVHGHNEEKQTAFPLKTHCQFYGITTIIQENGT